MDKVAEETAARGLVGFEYRGYKVARGLCGGVGVFSDGFQCATVATAEDAKAKVDDWIEGWWVTVRTSFDAADVAACRVALQACGELAEAE